MIKKCIVLDFDGTIADSESTILEIYKQFAKKAQWPTLTHKDYVKLRSGTVKDAMRWAGVKAWHLPRLLRAGRREYEKHTREINIFEGMAETIKQLAKSEFDIYVLSSNSLRSVKSIIAKNKLDEDVKILKSSPIFGKHKILKKLLKTSGYNPEQSWMIGDEVRDIEAGKKTGMNTMAVTWGLQNEAALKDAEPSLIGSKPADILQILELY